MSAHRSEGHLATSFSRRTVLRGSAVALGASALHGLTLAKGESRGAPRTLVVVFLRGGIDGLNLVVPYGDPAYAKLRPSIRIAGPGSEGGAVDLDGFFGLHPAAAALAPFFGSGVAACAHAVGTSSNTRSHFLEQDRWETAVDENGLDTAGWLNRYLEATPGAGPIRALALGERLPRSLRGDAPALALPGLDQLLPRDGSADDGAMDALERAYRGQASGARGMLARSGKASIEALRQLREVAKNPPKSEVEYPDTGLGRRARELARLVKANVGLELVELDFGGWDSHENQGGAQGPFGNRVRELAGALAALLRDLEQELDRVTVVTVSEFGRTAAQNGTGGTDHGWGNCVLAMGGAVQAAAKGRKGPVVGRWPGLELEQLNDRRDLAHTTEFRDVYGELLGFLGTKEAKRILPGPAFTPVGLVAGS